MTKDEVQVGKVYAAKISGNVSPVRIDAENTRGGWDATNMKTKKKVRIKSAQKLRYEVVRGEAKSEAAPAAKEEAGDKPRQKQPKAKKERTPRAGKMSALDAAAKVLGETGESMTTQEMIEKMAAKGYWTSPQGKTPHATLYAAILREITVKAKDSRFTKTERGKFAIAK